MSIVRSIHRFAIQTHKTELKSGKFKAETVSTRLKLSIRDWLRK
jgi:hypothetical protein